MRPALELTSVPRWAVTVTNPDADLSGRHWTVVAFGPDTGDVVARWSDQIARHRGLAAVRVHRVDDDEAARAAVDQDMARRRGRLAAHDGRTRRRMPAPAGARARGRCR